MTKLLFVQMASRVIKRMLIILINYFGESNVFVANPDETFQLTSNVLVVSPDVIVSNVKFNRLNSWLENKGVLVEEG